MTIDFKAHPRKRKQSLTPEVQRRFCEAVRLGATYEIACQYAGIHMSTYRRWMIRGDQEAEGIYRAFHDSVRQAEAAGAIANLATIEKAAHSGVWQAAAWKLERRYPQMYGRRVVETQDGGEAPAGDPLAKIDRVLDEVEARVADEADNRESPDGLDERD